MERTTPGSVRKARMPTGSSVSQMKESEEMTFLVTSFNCADFLENCIESVLAQTSSRWRILIGDDKSTDESFAIYERYADHPQIDLLFNAENQGTIRTLERLIDASKTDIMGILDSDDALDSHAVEKVLSVYNSQPDAGLVYSNFWYCDALLEPVSLGFSRAIPPGKTCLDVNCISHLKTFRRSAFRKTPGYDVSVSYAEDKDIVLKLEEVTPVYFIDEPLYYYRVLEHSMSHGGNQRAIALEAFKRSKRHARKRRLEKGIAMSWQQTLMARIEHLFSLLVSSR